MKSADRHDRIESIVNQEGSVTIASLKRHFPNISDMTLRRDLESMDKANRIIRVHGGARSLQPSVGMEDDYLRRDLLHVVDKQEIAQKTLSLIRPNTCFFIDSGTTATAVCRALPQERYLIYTSGLSCAKELKKLEKSEVYLLGGKLNTASLSTYGSAALDSIQNVHFYLAIVGSTGFDYTSGFTAENAEDAKLKREVLRRAEKRVVVMDSSKVGRVSTYTFAMPEDIDILVSDSRLDEDTKQRLIRSNVRLI